MRWLGCTLAGLLGWGVVGVTGTAADLPGPPLLHARARAPRPRALATSGPADAKELHPQPKAGDPVDPRRRPVPPAVLPPLPRKQHVAKRSPPLSLETDPQDLMSMPIDRDRFLWAASPRLRTGAWFAVYGLASLARRFRKYEPEIVYDKKDTVLMAEVGGALRLDRFELSMSVPLVGQLQADFYQKGVVDHDVSKVDRMDLNLTAKVAFPFQHKKSRFLLTPYITFGVPSGSREVYSTSIGGRQVEHTTSGPKAFAALPGIAAGWRRGMFSAVISVGILSRVLTKDDLTPDEEVGNLSVSWLGAYQICFAPWRDIMLMVGLTHLHQLKDRTPDEREDLFLFVAGVRFQPYSGLFGHAGASVPLGKRVHEQVPTVFTLAVGWEFQ